MPRPKNPNHPPVATTAAAPVPKGNRHARRAAAARQRRLARRTTHKDFGAVQVRLNGVRQEGVESMEWMEVREAVTPRERQEQERAR